jgi:hypothetical protein
MMSATRCRKLALAYDLLREILGRGPVPISVCLLRAREIGLSDGTMRAARKLLPIQVVWQRVTLGQNYWELTNDVVGEPPEFWRTPVTIRYCVGCSTALLERHPITKRCRRCQLARLAAAARAKAATMQATHGGRP